LVVAVTALCLLVTPPIAFLFGGVEWIALRKRRPFLAYHGLHIACYQVFYALVMCMVSLTIHFTHTSNALLTIISMPDNLAPREIVGTFPSLWQAFSLPERSAVLAVTALLVLNALIALTGVIVALCGRVFRLPLLGRLCQRITPPAG
jgi:hypothetical protein